jgi:Sec-independent protein secretion pathway component TatC
MVHRPSEATLTAQPPTPAKWLTGRRILTMVGATAVATIVAPPAVLLQIPTAIALWLGVELGLRAWRLKLN